MRNDNIRKYILPNIPYLFILWACLKVGTAYRLAAGGNMGQKLVGMMANRLTTTIRSRNAVIGKSGDRVSCSVSGSIGGFQKCFHIVISI